MKSFEYEVAGLQFIGAPAPGLRFPETVPTIAPDPHPRNCA